MSGCDNKHGDTRAIQGISVLRALLVAALAFAFLGLDEAIAQSSGGKSLPGIRHFETVQDLVSHRYRRAPAREKARERQVAFSAMGRRFDLQLTTNDLFAAGARELWIREGKSEERAPQIVLYKGRVEGSPGSWVRLAIRDGALDGTVWTEEEVYFLEP